MRPTSWVPEPLTIESGDLVALFLGGAVAAGIGAIDDLFDLRARWQLVGQLGLAGLAVALGIGVEVIANPFGSGVIRFNELFSVGFTVFWIVGMINSINWIDGLDGLSSGIALIAAVTLGLISLTTQIAQPMIAVLCFALAGALAGFLRWNFHPATIFAGTSGVQFVGYTLAVLSILGSAKVAIALLVLGVPIIDTFWIIVRRLTRGRSPVHARTARTSTTACWTWGCRIATPCSSSTASAPRWASSRWSSPRSASCTRSSGSSCVSGLILFGPTRGAFRRPEELEAEAYESER